jgi:hypothetical protein
MQQFSSKPKGNGPVAASPDSKLSAPQRTMHSRVARDLLARFASIALILAGFFLISWVRGTATSGPTPVGNILQAQTSCAGSSPCVTTYHNDANRDGVNPYEATLTVPTVSSGLSVKFTQTVDGQIYAQPLFVSSLFVNGASHNVVFVATQNNTVYAIDGDAGGILWSTSLNAIGETAVPYTDLPLSGSGQYCVNIIPEVGITGTPVIDASVTPPVLYVVSKNKESNGTWAQKLHAIETDTGGELTGSPFDVASHVAAFSAINQLQRTGLALSHDANGNANVYVAWGSHCDAGAYSGSIVGFNYNYTSQSFSVVGSFNPEGNTGRKSGIWMSGGAPAVDGNGNLYLSTGDGKWSGTAKTPLVPDSVVKLQQGTSSLTLADYYTPNDQYYLSQGAVGTGIVLSCGTGCSISNLPNNTDLGSGGVVLLQPSGISLAAPELIAGGKEGVIYVVDYQSSSNGVMGGLDGCGYNCTTGSDPTQTPCTTSSVPTTPGAIAYCFDAIPFSPPGETGSRGTPAFWSGSATNPENYLYTLGSQDKLKAFQMQSNGTFGSAMTANSPAANFSYPGASPSISWNSSTSDVNDAIVWVLNTGGFATLNRAAKPAVLYAYAAVPNNGSLVRLWDSASSGQTGPGAVKFVVPTVANGKVYVAGGTPGYLPNSSNCSFAPTSCGQLTVYGH